jgi:ligand-binding sensor domain-containing protein
VHFFLKSKEKQAVFICVICGEFPGCARTPLAFGATFVAQRGLMVRIPLLVFILLLLATPFQAQTSLVESISIEQGLSQGFVPAICQDEDGFLWFGTKNGLPDDVVYGILADDKTPRKLWISTNRGLARFSPETGQFQYYFKTDGLQDNEFNTYAASRRALTPSG